MFLLYCLILLVFVYTVPALAVFPKLALSSRTMVSIPFVSIAIVGVIQVTLAWGNIYTQPIVITISLTLLATTVIRLLALKPQSLDLYWPDTHRLLVIFILLFGLYWGMNLGSAAFDNYDEIYSWNLWAIMHYLDVDSDYYYFTRAPYPQLFPILISYCYKLLGGIEFQMPVKALFAIYTMGLWGAIAFAPKTASYRNLVLSLVILFLITISISKFSTGYADPLMASSLVVGIFLYIQYIEHPERYELLILSIICAGVAVFTKQAALIWALGSFPLITLIAAIRRKIPPAALLGAVVLLALGLFWIFVPGSDFQDNPGVINRSKEDRGVLEQLIFASGYHFWKYPVLPVLFLAGTVASLGFRKHLDIFFLFFIPSLLAWLIFGSYTVRLGLHVVAVAALLLAASNYWRPAIATRWLKMPSEKFLQQYFFGLVLIGIVLTSAASYWRVNENIKRVGEDFSLYTPGYNVISQFFGKDAQFIYESLYDKPNLSLWVPSHYIYGMFYGHTPIIRPAKVNGEYTQKTLLNEIETHRPDYLFESGQHASWGPFSKQLKTLAETNCPYLFEKVASPPNKLGLTTYHLRKHHVFLSRCKDSLN